MDNNKICIICKQPTTNKKIEICDDCFAQADDAEIELYIKLNWIGKDNV